MEKILHRAGYEASRLDIEAAWSAHCLSGPTRPDWSLATYIDDGRILMWLLEGLTEAPAVETKDVTIPLPQFVEPDHAGTAAEQDDGGTAPGQADEVPAEHEGHAAIVGGSGGVATAPADTTVKRGRGRPRRHAL